MTIIPWQRLPNDQRGPSDSMSPESGLNSHSLDIIMFKTEHMAPESTEKSGVRSMEGRSRRRSGVKRRSQPTSPSSTDRPQYPRTRTGCLTCRRRKKKCDESKPSCYNCIKNNYFCEGYETKRPWRKRGRSSPSALSVVPPQLPQIIGAIETPIDSQLLSYFVSDASSVLNIYSEGKNPFEELVIDMAFNHAGLMHSLICLSASCMIARQASPPQEVVVRQRHHFDRGVVCLRQKIEGYNMGLSTTNNGDHTILQTILHCLEAVVSGENQGSYRYHLIAAQGLMNTLHNMTNEVQEFARQFLLYHNVANSISSVSPMSCTQDGEDPISTTFREETPQSLPESNPSFPTIASIMHGLTTPISQTRLLREEIRKNKTLAESTHYATLDNLLPSYLNTDAQLRSWDSVFTPNTPHHWAALVYRQSAWAYLYRTVKSSTPSPELSQGVTGGMAYVKLILTDKTPKTRWLHGIMLPPLFLFGCAAFETTQREAITRALDTIFEYSRWGNISHIRRVLLGVWAYMDAGLEESWDWEEVMAEMGLDVMVS